MDWLLGWLAQASLGLLFGGLVVAGLGVPLPEDILLLAAGSLSHRTGLSPLLVVPVCMLGVLLGDSLLFNSARRLGESAIERPMFRRLLPPKVRQRVEALMRKRGPVIIFVARHVAGLRAPVFALAGMHGMPLKRFLVWDALGMLISVPVTIALGYFFSEHLDRVRAGVDHAEHWVLGGVVLALVVYASIVGARRTWRRGS